MLIERNGGINTFEGFSSRVLVWVVMGVGCRNSGFLELRGGICKFEAGREKGGDGVQFLCFLWSVGSGLGV